MKKIFAVLSVICLLVLSACGSASSSAGNEAPAATPEIIVTETVAPSPELVEPEPSAEPEPTPVDETDEPDEDNPVMNFVGPYYCEGCSIFIEAAGSKTCKATVNWSENPSEISEWHMSGPFDTETLSFKYENCVKTKYVYGDDGIITGSETVFENGSGSVAFTEDYMLSWIDNSEHPADGMLFVFSGGLMDQWDLS